MTGSAKVKKKRAPSKKTRERKYDVRKGKYQTCDVCEENPVVPGVYLWYTLNDGRAGDESLDQAICRECMNAICSSIVEARLLRDLESALMAEMLKEGWLEGEG